MRKLSSHFSLNELIFSETAYKNKIDNTPTEDEIQKLTDLCVDVLEPLRARCSIKYAKEIKLHINSGFRNKEVNKLVKGKPNSQHLKGEAVDITPEGITVQQLYDLIKELVEEGIHEVDQCILEYKRWVHISYRKGNNRKQIFEIN